MKFIRHIYLPHRKEQRNAPNIFFYIKAKIFTTHRKSTSTVSARLYFCKIFTAAFCSGSSRSARAPELQRFFLISFKSIQSKCVAKDVIFFSNKFRVYNQQNTQWYIAILSAFKLTAAAEARARIHSRRMNRQNRGGVLILAHTKSLFCNRGYSVQEPFHPQQFQKRTWRNR